MMSQSSYDAGAASDEQAQENDEQRGGYDGGDGSASQTTTPASVSNPPKSTSPLPGRSKMLDHVSKFADPFSSGKEHMKNALHSVIDLTGVGPNSLRCKEYYDDFPNTDWACEGVCK